MAKKHTIVKDDGADDKDLKAMREEAASKSPNPETSPWNNATPTVMLTEDDNGNVTARRMVSIDLTGEGVPDRQTVDDKGTTT